MATTHRHIATRWPSARGSTLTTNGFLVGLEQEFEVQATHTQTVFAADNQGDHKQYAANQQASVPRVGKEAQERHDGTSSTGCAAASLAW